MTRRGSTRTKTVILILYSYFSINHINLLSITILVSRLVYHIIHQICPKNVRTLTKTIPLMENAFFSQMILNLVIEL